MIFISLFIYSFFLKISFVAFYSFDQERCSRRARVWLSPESSSSLKLFKRFPRCLAEICREKTSVSFLGASRFGSFFLSHFAASSWRRRRYWSAVRGARTKRSLSRRPDAPSFSLISRSIFRERDEFSSLRKSRLPQARAPLLPLFCSLLLHFLLRLRFPELFVLCFLHTAILVLHRIWQSRTASALMVMRVQRWVNLKKRKEIRIKMKKWIDVDLWIFVCTFFFKYHVCSLCYSFFYRQ